MPVRTGSRALRPPRPGEPRAGGEQGASRARGHRAHLPGRAKPLPAGLVPAPVPIPGPPTARPQDVPIGGGRGPRGPGESPVVLLYRSYAEAAASGMTSSALTVTSSPVPVKASGRRSRASEGVAVSAEPNGPGCAGGVSSLPAPVAQGEAVTARGGGGGGGGGCPGAARCRVSSAGSAPAPARPWVPALGPCPGSPPAPPAHGAAARSPLRRSAGRAHRYAEPDPGQGGVCEGVQTRVQAVPVTPVRLYLYPHSYKLHTSTALPPPPR